jgi:hypothetical protein
MPIICNPINGLVFHVQRVSNKRGWKRMDLLFAYVAKLDRKA